MGRLKSTWEIDEEFFQYSAHIDNVLMAKIERGEYMDLARLLLKQKVLHNDGCLNMIEKDGVSFLQPVSEKDIHQINNLRCWE